MTTMISAAKTTRPTVKGPGCHRGLGRGGFGRGGAFRPGGGGPSGLSGLRAGVLLGGVWLVTGGGGGGRAARIAAKSDGATMEDSSSQRRSRSPSAGGAFRQWRGAGVGVPNRAKQH